MQTRRTRAAWQRIPDRRWSRGSRNTGGVNRETPARCRSPAAPGARCSRRGSSFLREFTGVIEWGPDAFVYLEIRDESAGSGSPSQLVAFDESGEVRILYPVEVDVSVPVLVLPSRPPPSHRSSFSATTWGRSCDSSGSVRMLLREAARRVEVEKHEDVDSPAVTSSWPAHSSVQRRRARSPLSFWSMVRAPRIETTCFRGCDSSSAGGSVSSRYEKRGAGGSSGDWNISSFDDLAPDVVAADGLT